MNKQKKNDLFSLMDERKNFINLDINHVSKINNAKKITKEKIEKNCKISFDNKTPYIIIIIILCIIILILLGIIFSRPNNEVKLVYKEHNEVFYTNKSQSNELKSLFLFKEDKTEIKDKNKIRICYCIDNNSVYPTLVSMTSALENNDKEKNVIIFYLFVSHNFNKKKVEIFDSLKKKYLVKIHYYMIPPRFNRLRKWTWGTATVYFKLYIPLVLPNLERILYLDADTLIYQDLSELFTLDFHGNYAMGYPFHSVKMINRWNKKLVNYINGGVLLFNIKKITKDNKDAELLKFALKNHKRLFFLEQDALNLVFFNKTGLLPLKYGIYLFGNITTYRKKVKKELRVHLNETELIDALQKPALLHLAGCFPKVWTNKKYKNCFKDTSVCFKPHKDFYFYANKTDYAEKIIKKYIKKKKT